MAEIVNLRQARKGRTRVERERQAEENRLRFGRPKAERGREAILRGKAASFLEAHKRDNREGGD